MPKTVMITGATGALGSEVANTFSDAGWKLLLPVRSDREIDSLTKKYPDAVVAVLDLARFKDTRTWVTELSNAGAQIDALINVAGGFAMQPAASITETEYQRLFEMNFQTVLSITTAVLPGMLDRRAGFIAGISAGAGISGGGGMAMYAASKAAVAVYLKSVHDEVSRQGVRVSIIYPMGAIDTPSNRSAMPDVSPAGWLDPTKIAEAILFLATLSRRSHVRELKLYAE